MGGIGLYTRAINIMTVSRGAGVFSGPLFDFEIMRLQNTETILKLYF